MRSRHGISEVTLSLAGTYVTLHGFSEAALPLASRYVAVVGFLKLSSLWLAGT